jgi:hypothetical protein
MGLNVSALADFNNQVAGEVVPRMVFEGYTTSILPIKEGIKYQEPLNIMDVDLVVQTGNCVSTASGSLVATQRNITVTKRVSYDALCLDQLDAKYLGISALDAGSYSETFKLAEAYTDMLVNQMKKSDDRFLWNSSNLGALTSGSTSGVVVPNAATGSVSSATILDITDALIENLDSDVADRDDLTIWMSVANFRKFVTALRSENSFFFDPGSIINRTGILQMQYPFQNVKVVGTTGITGDRICLMPDAYAVVGTDLVSDETSFQLWYDVNSDQLKHRIKSKLGVQVAFPEYIVSNNKAAQ